MQETIYADPNEEHQYWDTLVRIINTEPKLYRAMIDLQISRQKPHTDDQPVTKGKMKHRLKSLMAEVQEQMNATDT